MIKAWNGRFVCYHSKKSQYDIIYWPIDGNEADDGEKYTLHSHQLAADMYCGDLSFV